MHVSRDGLPVSSLVSRPSASRLAGDDVRFPIALMLGWFAAQVVLRVLVSDSLELDEAEQTLAARELALGYGSQPPLYTWLQHAFFRIFGVSVFSLALAKNLMLFAAGAFTLLAARLVTTRRAAWLGTLSMLWLVSLSWEAQRDLTHTVLATTTSAGALYAFVSVAQRPTTSRYAALGLALGLAMLAKYNNVAFAALLCATTLVVPELRRRVVSARLMWTIVVALLVVAPHAIWLLEHWQLASAGTMTKMGVDPARMSAVGLGSGLLALVGLATPFWIVVLGFFGRRAWSPPFAAEAARVVSAYLLLFIAMIVILVVVGGVTHFKPRWFVPGLFALPVMFFAVRPALAESRRAVAYRYATLAFGVLLFVLLAAKVPVQGRFGTPGDLNEPVGALAAALRADGFRQGVIVSDERRLAARLRVQFPDSIIVLADEKIPQSAHDMPLLIIRSGDDLSSLLAKIGQKKATPGVQRIELPYLHGDDRLPRAQYAWVSITTGVDWKCSLTTDPSRHFLHTLITRRSTPCA